MAIAEVVTGMGLLGRQIRLQAPVGAWRYAWLGLAISGLTIGCGAVELDPAPTPGSADFAPIPAARGNPTLEKTLAPGSGPDLKPTPLPLPGAPSTPVLAVTPTPTTVAISLSLQLLAPTEGAGVEVGAVRVLGVTSPDASVEINGAPTEVRPDGSFQRDLLLQEGINSVLAVARSPWGAEASDNVLVLFVPRSQGVPLSVLFPQGLEVSHPEITIIGATRQDAVVGVNGVPVEVNSLGIFSTEVSLEVGANLIEVLAVDLEESVNFQTVVAFYIP